MLGFLFGLIAGGVSGYMTYDGTGQTGFALTVGIIVFLVGWLLGLFFFGDASNIEFL
jgi:hypothetical protein